MTHRGCVHYQRFTYRIGRAIGATSLIAVTLTTPVELEAQSMMASAVRQFVRASDGDGLNGYSLTGAEAGFELPVGEGRYTLRVFAQLGAQTRHPIGSICSAFGPPTGCDAESIRSLGSHSSISVGIGAQSFATERSMLEFTVDAGPGFSYLRQTGEVSREWRERSAATLDVRVGAVESWWPFARSSRALRDFALRAAVALGGYHPLFNDYCADCWAPLGGTLGSMQFSLGVGYMPDFRRRSR